ncbi:PadR family transcriptional regulator [Kitasatospora sp. NPDC086009]|uniref:PadR family transcriptional regulator n=1 Tax=unclassified Kitasatospora TaxID=2633591 RepID=UPI0037C75CB5
MKIKVTMATAKVLRLFVEEPTAERYGWEIMQATALGSGSLYPILARLEREGVIAGAQEDIDPKAEGRPARRFYTITGEGLRIARQALAELHEITRVPGTTWQPGLSPQGG